MPLLGAHMSIAGGYYKAVEAAAEAGCDCVQVFTKTRPNLLLQKTIGFGRYPTLLSPDKATQMVTGQEGFLYFARGRWGTNHTGWRRPFTIEQKN